VAAAWPIDRLRVSRVSPRPHLPREKQAVNDVRGASNSGSSRQRISAARGPIKKVPGEPPGDRVLALVLRGCNRRQMTTTFDCLHQVTAGGRGCQACFFACPTAYWPEQRHAYWPQRRSLIGSGRKQLINRIEARQQKDKTKLPRAGHYDERLNGSTRIRQISRKGVTTNAALEENPYKTKP